MGNAQIFGSAGALVPPVTVDGVDYGLLLRFKSSPESDHNINIVSGVIERVEDLGGGRYKVVCARGREPFSYILSVPGWGAIEVQYYCTIGGNICNHPEPMRPYNHLSSRSVRGDLARTRAEEYDMLWAGPSNARQGFFIEEAVAFGEAPGELNYQVEDVEGTVSYIALDFMDLFLPAPDRSINIDAAIDLDLAGGGYYDDAGFWMMSSGGALTALSRKVFGGDEELYPSGATLAQGEYWIDGTRHTIRLSSLNATYGSTLAAGWYETGQRKFTTEALRSVVIDGAGAGYDEEADADETVGMAFATRGDDEAGITIFPGGLENYGSGAIEWDFPTVGRKVILIWDGGFVTAVKARVADGGPMVDQAFTANASAWSGNVALYAEKNGDEVTLSYQVGSDPITEIATVELPGVVTGAFGRLGAHAWDGNKIKVLFPVGVEVERVGAAGGGSIARYNFRFFEGLEFYRDYLLPSESAIESVTSMWEFGAYSEGNSSTARARNRYQKLPSNTVRFYCETAPDRVRVRQAEAMPAEEGAGRAPQFPRALNMATADENGMATGELSENISNWHDYVIVRTHDGGAFPFGGGDAFNIMRNAVLDPRASYKLEADIRDGEGDWTELTEGVDYLARPAEGVFLISSAWIAGNVGEGATPCFRLTGKFVTHHANLDARQINELAGAIDAFGTLYTEAPVNGSGSQIAGFMVASAVVPTGVSCVVPCETIVDGLMVGVPRVDWETYANACAFGGIELPANWKDFSTGGLWDVVIDQSGSGAEAYTTAANTAWTDCDDGDGHACGGYNLRGFGTDTRIIVLYPWGNMPGAPSIDYFGSDIEHSAGPGFPPKHTDTMFKFSGVGFELPEKLKRLVKTGTIVKAWIETKFEGLQSRKWTYTVDDVLYRRWVNAGAAPSVDYSYQAIVNGAVTYEGTSEVDWTMDPGGIKANTRTKAEITYNLVGRRRDSNSVFFDLSYYHQLSAIESPTEEQIATLIEANTSDMQEGRFSAFGTGLSLGTEVESGVWTPVDCTAAIRGLFEARESECVDFQLFPSPAGVNFNSSEGSLRGYLLGLDPVINFNVTEHADWFVYDIEVSGQWTQWEHFAVGSLHVRVALAGGILEDIPCPPLARGVMMAL